MTTCNYLGMLFKRREGFLSKIQTKGVSLLEIETNTALTPIKTITFSYPTPHPSIMLSSPLRRPDRYHFYREA